MPLFWPDDDDKHEPMPVRTTAGIVLFVLSAGIYLALVLDWVREALR